MSPSDLSGAPVCPSAAEINAQLRAHAAGRVVWTVEARAELWRLTGEWWAAVEREQVLAA